MGSSFKYTRCSAIAQTALGILLVVFGIADRATMHLRIFYTASGVPIWLGIWIFITGVIGLLGTPRNRANQNNNPPGAMIGIYVGFSKICVVFAVVIIILYVTGLLIHVFHGCYYYYLGDYVTKCRTSIALASMVVIFAILELGFGIMACVCGCNSSAPQMQPQGQVFYIQNAQLGQTPHVLTQSTDGIPVAVPVEGAVLSQSQTLAIPANQVVYPSSYNAGAMGGYSQSPPLQEHYSDPPPSYQP